MAVGPTKKKVTRYLIIEAGVIILVVEPDARGLPKSGKKDQPQPTSVAPLPLPATGHICNTIPLQNIEVKSVWLSSPSRWRLIMRMIACFKL